MSLARLQKEGIFECATCWQGGTNAAYRAVAPAFLICLHLKLNQRAIRRVNNFNSKQVHFLSFSCFNGQKNTFQKMSHNKNQKWWTQLATKQIYSLMKAVRQQDCETLSLKDSPASKELKVLFFSSSNANRAQSRGGYKVLCASTQPAQHSFLMITLERMLPDEKKRERQNICLFSLICLYTNITYRQQSMVFLYCLD